MRRYISLAAVFGFLLWCCGYVIAAETGDATEDAQPTPQTINNPQIPLDELELMVDHMTSDELMVEADGWLGLLKQAVSDLNQAELEVKRNKKQEQSANKAALPEASSTSEAKHGESGANQKAEMLDKVAKLQEARTEVVDRLNLVLANINEKIGLTSEGKELDQVLPYRRYINAVSGLKVDVSDAGATWGVITSWLVSKEGGVRWAKYIILFLVAVAVFWVLGGLLSRATEKALSFAGNTSMIFRHFVVTSVRRVMIVLGILVGLAAMDINIAPLLAVIGAAGFIVAFALQNTLSNFASGLMIMLYKPFDVGDAVDVSGVVGKVRSMTLMTTTIMTFDNKLTIVPNNSIWGNVITNATGSSERRVDMVFGIGYDDDIHQVQRVLEEVVTSHPLVLKTPEPVIQLNELGDSSVNFICRPWVKTGDYWTVYWDITRTVKERFDADGISIPFPQRDVHLYGQLTPSPLQPAVASAASTLGVSGPSSLDGDRNGDNS
ncbi:MAG: mechanosensitive ion channel family protein [Gammaproteobacteria bacterium]|nr:mechanosensitive ion channel family protein [Gammaproteobacteria bacterium]